MSHVPRRRIVGVAVDMVFSSWYSCLGRVDGVRGRSLERGEDEMRGCLDVRHV